MLAAYDRHHQPIEAVSAVPAIAGQCVARVEGQGTVDQGSAFRSAATEVMNVGHIDEQGGFVGSQLDSLLGGPDGSSTR